MEFNYHRPVMLNECLEGLDIKPEGVYVDVTFGGGGHSKEIIKKLDESGVLVAFDQDEDAKRNVIDDERFVFVDQNFRYLKNNLRMHDLIPVDGILADLGVSSHQFDVPERGFSIRFDGELDMRMDQSSDLTARQVVNTYSEEELHKIFGIYGEIQNAKTLAKVIVTARLNAEIVTVADLKNAIVKLVPRGKENKYLAQVFQALRIEVNQEMEALKEFLEQTVEVLRPGGRLVVMSYHSLEDRLVKNFMAKGKFSGMVEKDFFGNEIKPFTVLTKKSVTATEEKMTNRLKTPLEEPEELVEEQQEEEVEKVSSPGFFTMLFTKGVVSKETATDALPFIVFFAFLGMIYIGNRHNAENNIRKIDKLNKEVKELSWDFKTLKADLMFKSKQTEVVKRVDSVLGLKVPVQPPIKIKVSPDEYKN